MTLTPERIQEAVPTCSPGWAVSLVEAMVDYSITTTARAEMFLAQCAHESMAFTKFEENLNYSAQGLMRTWPSRFTSFAFAASYARQPERIANYVYANRLGNGNEASGDGWKYRGRGAIQITGRFNYLRAGAGIGYPLDAHPTDAALPKCGSQAAAWFWRSNGLNELADAGDFAGITQRINGGLTGQAEREKWLARIRAVLTE